jgi:DNA-binding transcriptional regulator YiaG
MISLMVRKKKTATGDNPWPARLIRIRKRLNLTQREAAERIGTVLRTWQNWEYGRRIPNRVARAAILRGFTE